MTLPYSFIVLFISCFLQNFGCGSVSQDTIIYAQIPFTTFNKHISELINGIDSSTNKHQQHEQDERPRILNQDSTHVVKITELMKQLQKLKSDEKDNGKNVEHQIQYIQQQLDKDKLLSWRSDPLYHQGSSGGTTSLYPTKGLTTTLSIKDDRTISEGIIPALVIDHKHPERMSKEQPFIITSISHPVDVCFDIILEEWQKQLTKFDDLDTKLKQLLENPVQEKHPDLIKLIEIVKRVLRNNLFETLTVDRDKLHITDNDGYGCSNIQWDLLHPRKPPILSTKPKLKIDLVAMSQGEDWKLTPLLVLSQFDLVLVTDHTNFTGSSSSSLRLKKEEEPELVNQYLKSLTALQLQFSFSFIDMLKTSPLFNISSTYKEEHKLLNQRRSRHIMIDQLIPMLRPYLLKVNSLDLEMYQIASIALDIHSQHTDRRANIVKQSTVISPTSPKQTSSRNGMDWMPEIIAVHGEVGSDPVASCSDGGGGGKSHDSLFNNVLDILREFYHPGDEAMLKYPMKKMSPYHYDVKRQPTLPPFFTYTQQELEDALVV